MTKKFTILAIDPGLQACGWAIFENSKLAACGLARPVKSMQPIEMMKEIIDQVTLAWEQNVGHSAHPDILVAERPQIYQVGKGDPNDLIPLAILDGAVWQATEARGVMYPLPREWKGQVPKDVMNKRTLDKLSEKEYSVVKENLSRMPKSLHHNAIDAIGLGQWAIGRIGK